MSKTGLIWMKIDFFERGHAMNPPMISNKQFTSLFTQYVECGRLSKEPTGKLQGSVTTPGSLAFAQQQQKLQQQQNNNGSGSAQGQPTSNSTPVNVSTATTAASKLPLSMKDVQV